MKRKNVLCLTTVEFLLIKSWRKFPCKKSFLLVALQWQQPFVLPSIHPTEVSLSNTLNLHQLRGCCVTVPDLWQGSSSAVLYPGFFNGLTVWSVALAVESLYLPCSFSALCPARWVFFFLVTTVHVLLLIVAKVPNCFFSFRRTLDVMRALMKINALLSWGPYRLRLKGALDLVVWSWVGGSEREKKKRSQPSWRGLNSKLCCLSSVLLLLGACVHAVLFPLLFLVVCEGDNDRLQTSRVKMSQSLSGKACWLARSPLAEARHWPVLS